MNAVATAPEAGGLHRWSDERRSTAAAVLSLLLHGVLAALCVIGLKLTATPRKPVVKKQAVAMRTISRSQWESNRLAHSTSAAAAAQLQAKARPEPKPKGQVVDVAPGNNRARADAKYLAETSNTVDRETRARETTPFYANAQPRTTTTVENPQKAVAQPIPEQRRGNRGHGMDDAPMAARARTAARVDSPASRKHDLLAMRTPDQSGAGITASNLLARTTPPTPLSTASNETASDAARPEASPSEGREGSDAATRSEASSGVQGQVAGAAANDALRDVPIGDGTFLNTREWKFAGFMNRVKQSVGARWQPNRVLERSRTSSGSGERTTVLMVRLSAEGQLADVRVVKSSGDTSLDEEAVAAFERAQPFPNPPRGLVEEDGCIRFNFGFLLDLEGRGAMRGFPWRPGN